MNTTGKEICRSTGLWSSSSSSYSSDDASSPKSKAMLSTGLWSSDEEEEVELQSKSSLPKAKNTGLWSSSSEDDDSASYLDLSTSKPIIKAEMMLPEREEGELSYSGSLWSGEYEVKDEASLSSGPSFKRSSSSEYGYFTTTRKQCEEPNGNTAAAPTWTERDSIVVASSDYGFTITNGRDSFSHNGIDETWALLLRYVLFALCEAMPENSVIYISDPKTYFRVEKCTKNITTTLNKTIKTEIVGRDMSICPICYFADCHVWTANEMMNKLSGRMRVRGLE